MITIREWKELTFAMETKEIATAEAPRTDPRFLTDWLNLRWVSSSNCKTSLTGLETVHLLVVKVDRWMMSSLVSLAPVSDFSQKKLSPRSEASMEWSLSSFDILIWLRLKLIPLPSIRNSDFLILISLNSHLLEQKSHSGQIRVSPSWHVLHWWQELHSPVVLLRYSPDLHFFLQRFPWTGLSSVEGGVNNS